MIIAAQVMDLVGISCSFQNCQTVFSFPNLMSANEFKGSDFVNFLGKIEKSHFLFLRDGNLGMITPLDRGSSGKISKALHSGLDEEI